MVHSSASKNEAVGIVNDKFGALLRRVLTRGKGIRFIPSFLRSLWDDEQRFHPVRKLDKPIQLTWESKTSADSTHNSSDQLSWAM